MQAIYSFCVGRHQMVRGPWPGSWGPLLYSMAMEGVRPAALCTHASSAGCEETDVGAIQEWIRHSRRFFPRGLAREVIDCDVDEALWPAVGKDAA